MTVCRYMPSVVRIIGTFAQVFLLQNWLKKRTLKWIHRLNWFRTTSMTTFQRCDKLVLICYQAQNTMHRCTQGCKIWWNVTQKSEVLSQRCQNLCQHCKYYLKYWSQGRSRPLDPPGGQNFQCFMKWDGLTGHGGLLKSSNQFFMKNYCSEPFSGPPRVQ